jgi:hypothetical protein
LLGGIENDAFILYTDGCLAKLSPGNESPVGLPMPGNIVWNNAITADDKCYVAVILVGSKITPT